MLTGALPDPISRSEDIATAVAWLASEEARQITGVQRAVGGPVEPRAERCGRQPRSWKTVDHQGEDRPAVHAARRGGGRVTGNCCAGDGRAGGGSAGIRVLLVDDHPMVRRALAEALSDEDDLTVVGECEDGEQAVEAAERLRPDVVFMDVSMAGTDGLAATAALRAARPEARVIVLTGEGPEVGPEAVVAGAHALVPKGTRLGPLLRCLRTVAGGGTDCPYCL